MSLTNILWGYVFPLGHFRRKNAGVEADDVHTRILGGKVVKHLEHSELSSAIDTCARKGGRVNDSSGGVDYGRLFNSNTHESLDGVKPAQCVELECLQHVLGVRCQERSRRYQGGRVGDEDVQLADLLIDGPEGQIDLGPVHKVGNFEQDRGLRVSLGLSDVGGGILESVAATTEDGDGFCTGLAEGDGNGQADTSAPAGYDDILT